MKEDDRSLEVSIEHRMYKTGEPTFLSLWLVNWTRGCIEFWPPDSHKGSPQRMKIPMISWDVMVKLHAAIGNLIEAEAVRKKG